MREHLHVLRSLARRPGAWLLPALTLALAIGGVGALLSLFNAVMVRPLGVRAPDRLVAVYPGLGEALLGIPLTTLRDLDEGQSLVEDLCGYVRGAVNVEVRGVTAPHVTEAFTGGCYRMLGVEAHAGRLFDERDAPDGGPPAPVAVISHQFWQRAFGADPSIIGRETVELAGVRLTIVGVTPPAFRGIDAERAPDFTTPLFGTFALLSIGRLRDGVTLAEAQRYLPQRWPEIWARTNPATPGQPVSPASTAEALRVESIARGLSEQRTMYGTALTRVLTLSLLLLLLATLDVGGVLLARAMARDREFAVRGMLGAGRFRLGSLVAVEGLAIAIVAGVSAAPMAWWLSRALFTTMWIRLTPTTMDVSPDARVLLTLVCLGLGAGAIVALPAIAVVCRPRSGAGPGRTVVAGASRLQRALIVAQVSVSFVLLLGAGLFTRNLAGLRSIDPGYDADALRWTRLELGAGQPRAIDQPAYFRPLLDRLEALRQVDRAALSMSFPTTERRHVTALAPLRRQGAAIDDPGVPGSVEYVSPGFFDALGVPVLRGRALTWADVAGQEPTAVLNQTLATRLFPDGEAVGDAVLLPGPGADTRVTVVGVAGDSSPGDVRIGALPILYLSMLQNPQAVSPNVILRVGGEDGLNGGVRDAVEAAGRHRVSGLETIRDQADRFFMRERVLAALAVACAGLSVLVGGLGLYGLVAQTMLARTRELGVRVALGATPAEVVSRFTWEGLRPVVLGVVVGIPLAFIVARGLAVLLWDLPPTDPLSYAVALTALLVVAALASAWPALRASRIHPAEALRQE